MRAVPTPQSEPARAHRADEGIDLPVGLLPDLRAGGFVMTLTVGHVIELVGPDRPILFLFGVFLGQPPGDVNIIFRILVGDGRHFAQVRAA